MMKKINYKKELSIIEIVILVVSSFAFSYILYEGSAKIENIEKMSSEARQIEANYKLGKITLDIAKKLIEKLKEPIMPMVSAEVSFSCCEKTINNSICQDVVLTSDCQAGKQLAPTKCEQTSFCQPGCCADLEEGTFDKNVPSMLCPIVPGKKMWYSDKNCNLPAARLGCCVLGSNTQFMTQGQCTKASTDRAQGNGSAIVDWRQVNEATCVGLSMSQEEGACLTGNRGCKFGTKTECISLTGSASKFFPNVLCTSPDLNTTCQKTETTKCIEGKDEVYFVDSCGNRANIYDSSKVNNISYWSQLTSKNASCGSNSSGWNKNSQTCGNCFRFGEGSICAPKNASNINPVFGNYFCKDTSCKYKNETYKNGESWCVYDGAIGNGDDVVGSRHWKYVCNQGEIQIEPCADYRNQICIQSNNFDVNGTNVSFKNAACVANNWRACIDLNTEKGNISECEKTLNCRVEKVEIADNFKFDICTPKYPGGFQLNNEGEQKSAEQICGLASQTCTVIYQQTMLGSCECKTNCDCEKEGFAQKMNDFCRKLGDCGLEPNVEGKYNENNYAVAESPALSSNWIAKLVALSKPVPGQYASVENYTGLLTAAGLLGPTNSSGNESEGGESILSNAGMYLGIGAIGASFATVLMSTGSVSATMSFFSGTLPSLAGGGYGLAGGGVLSAGAAAFASAALVGGIGIIAGSFIAKMLGLSPIGSMVMSAGVGMVAMGTAMQMNLIPVLVNPIALIVIGAILIIISLFLMGSECEPVEVVFTCKPWQPLAVGGDECKKCNDDPLKPCSEYRCNSLGAACKIVNKGTKEEMCYDDNPNDVTPPVINPNINLGNLTNTSITNTSTGIRITNLNGGCVNAYTNLAWGINTDEPAQCKFDLQMRDKFEDMVYDLGTNGYVYNHTTNFMIPDIDGCGLNVTGDFRFYIKCKDTHGNIVPGFYTAEMCVNRGNDKIAPLIKATNPENNKLISFNGTTTNFSVYTNEPSDCKWGDADKTYDEMTNSMNCTNSCRDLGAYGYKCNADLPITNSTNTFYIRCKDQPWLQGNETGDKTRNANVESLVYTLNKPSAPLTITGVAPNTDFDIFNSPTTGKIRVTTSGGGQYPKCSYRVGGYSLVTMQNTFSSPHEQEIPWYPGLYSIYIECQDETGDKVSTTTNFEVRQDRSVPVIARIYKSGSSIKIITSENADCRYSTNRDIECAFSYLNASSMGSGTMHTISSSVGINYFIKCKDSFGNVPDGCSAVVTPTI